MKHPVKHVVEYAALRLAAFGLSVAPHRVALGFAWIIAALGYAGMGSKRERTYRRIRQVFSDLPAREVRRIAWISWRNLFFNAVETMRAARITPAWIRKVIDLKEAEAFLEKNPAKGCIYAVPHFGNWELAGLALSRLGIPLMTIVRRQKNLLTDGYLYGLRTRTGVETVYQDLQSFTRIIHGLKRGKNLAILPDLRAKSHFIPATFLGHPARIPAGMAMFSRKADAMIVPCHCSRIGWSRHTWHAGEPIRPDPALGDEEDQARMTRAVLDHFDRAIREDPAQYFWFNKRWVLGEDAPAR
jgi:KDO2-lipid IV(A) lauroyltransferase